MKRKFLFVASSFFFFLSLSLSLFPVDYSEDIEGLFLLEADASAVVSASAALYRAAYKWWITNIDPCREGAKGKETDGAKGRWKIIRVTPRAKSEFTNEMCHRTDASAAG